MTTITCKVSQPNVKLGKKPLEIGSIVEVSEDTAALFPLAFIPVKSVKPKPEKAENKTSKSEKKAK